MKKALSLILVISLTLLLFASCGSGSESGKTETSSTAHTKILFTMENGETFTVETYPEYAPETCENFVNLVKDGFYDGLTFHRVIAGFMAQGGDPEGNGTGGSDKDIYGEFSANGFSQNTLSHTRGVISMARNGQDMNSASSQFFICYSDDYTSTLDGNYAAFGKVIDGMETVDNFLKIKMAYSAGDRQFSSPTEPIVIKTAEVIE
jgi:peptidylprolyl isomerase/peptidyl-prolyl cis-trans isomerase B (cyclophilin B)